MGLTFVVTVAGDLFCGCLYVREIASHAYGDGLFM